MSAIPRLKIALSAPDVNTAGGIERIVTEAANWLVRAGHEVTVYAARVDRHVLDEGVKVKVVRVPAKLDVFLGIGFRGRAKRMIEADRPDVHGAFSALSPLGGVYWIPSVHRVAYDLLLEWRKPFQQLPVKLHPFHRTRLHFERQVFADGYERLLAFAEGTRSDVVRLYGLPPQALDVLPVGYDPGAFNPVRKGQMRREARAHLGYGPDDRVLLFVANELERKGFRCLIEAVALLDQPSVKVLGAGRVAPDAYRRLIVEEGLGDRVQWIGSSNDVGYLHAASDAFVLPTRYEAWGLVIVEALGSGLPVVTSRQAGAAITVRHEQTGRLLEDPEDVGELADALSWALSSQPGSSEEIASSVHAYTWKEIVGRYEKVLREVAAQGRNGPPARR